MKGKIGIERIDENSYERVFVTSDIHGRYDLFSKLLKKIDLKRGDLLIIMGDICDRGKDTYKIYARCVRMLKLGYNVKIILGNHEDMLLENIQYGFPMTYETEFSFYQNSKYFKEKSFKEWHRENFENDIKWLIDWIKKWPLVIVGKENIFVHAGLNLDVPLDEQERETVLWTREKFWLKENFGLEEYRNKNIYFGHTPSYNGRISCKTEKIWDIDCGAFFSNFLGCVEVKSREKIYVFVNEPIQFSEVRNNVFLELWKEEIEPFVDNKKYKIEDNKMTILEKFNKDEKAVIKNFLKKYDKLFEKNTKKL